MFSIFLREPALIIPINCAKEDVAGVRFQNETIQKQDSPLRRTLDIIVPSGITRTNSLLVCSDVAIPWDSVTRKRLVKDKSFAFPAARESSEKQGFLRRDDFSNNS